MRTRELILGLSLIFLLTACAGSGRQPVATTPSQPAPAPKKAGKPTPPAPAPQKKSSTDTTATAPRSDYETVVSHGEKLLLFGQTEFITILPHRFRLPARIDTGATTSSIHALDIKRFERDGKKWVRFTLVGPDGRKYRMEKPWLRTIEVKRHGTRQQVRPVVKLKVRMGPLEIPTQFSLTDRSQFKYPVLIGRSLLQGVAAVDVNREYILTRMSGGGHEK